MPPKFKPDNVTSLDWKSEHDYAKVDLMDTDSTGDIRSLDEPVSPFYTFQRGSSMESGKTNCIKPYDS